MKYQETKRWVNSAGKGVSEGLLTIGDESFKCISGGGGKGPLPSGKYLVKKAYFLPSDFPNKEAYSKNGYSFFTPLVPQFNTDRTQLGIHPDGNVPGTLGCIGLTEKIAKAWELLSAIPKEGTMLDVTMLKKEA